MNTNIGCKEEVRYGNTDEQWTQFYRNWQRLVRAVAFFYVDGNDHLINDLDDVVQIAWWKIVRGWPRCRQTGIATWLWTVTKNAAIDYIRANPSLHDYCDISDMTSIPSQQSASGEAYVRYEELLTFVLELPVMYAEPFLLSVTGHTGEEIARATGTTEAAARQRVCRAGQKLRRRLQTQAMSRRMPGHSNRS